MKFSIKKRIAALLFVLLFLPVSVGSTEVSADDLIYLTENFPPHNFIKNGQLVGASIEIIEMIWQKLGASKTRNDIQITPWARGLKQLENDPRTALFGMGYSRERALKFHWVGPYYTHAISLITKSDRLPDIITIEDAKNLHIGVVREDMGHQILLKNGFSEEKIDLSSDIDILFQKLKYKRFDMICYVTHSFFKYLETNGHDTLDYKSVYQIAQMKSGFGFNRQIPIQLINKFQLSLNQLIHEKKIDPILKKYKMK
jgi:polar amino acid transport system substrate-binding protein